YGATVEKGVRYLVKRQSAAGIFDDLHLMYAQGICTLTLAEVIGMTDAKLSQDCRKALERGVKVILRAQATSGAAKGGWRYTPHGNDADLSVTGWQLLALRAAKNAGCDIPAEPIDRAVHYVLSCRDASTPGFGYVPGGPTSVACTGTGILCLEICGKERHRGREALQAGAVLLKAGVNWNQLH